MRRKLEEHLLVDGYNIIFAWDDLKELAQVNVDGARGKLLDILSNYQAICRCRLIVVFDAYRVKGHTTEIMGIANIHVVYTKEAETADQYIEKFAHENRETYHVTVLDFRWTRADHHPGSGLQPALREGSAGGSPGGGK